MKCPKCKKSVDDTIVNDGGSSYCYSCKIAFHYCNDGIKYSSPGPIMCEYCKSYNTHILNYLTSPIFLIP